MSLEHSPARATDAAIQGPDPAPSPAEADGDYWHALIDEKAAADFLDLTDRTMQKKRQRGDGPRYIVLSSRCIKYTRLLLKEYADERLRSSTSDPGRADT